MPASVLVVDDDDDIRDALGEILRDEGFAVRAARDGRDALAQIAEDEPDLLLLDLMMPVMTGWEVLDALRRSKSAVRIVVLSAVGAEGRPYYIQKPISLDRLLQLVEMVRTVSTRRMPAVRSTR